MAAGFQVVVMRRIAHGELTNEFLKIAGDDQIRAARSVVWGLRGKPLDDWTTEELGAAERAAATYDELGFLLLHSYIKSEPFLEFFGDQLTRFYLILEPMIMQKRIQWGRPNHWVYLEWLAARASTHGSWRKPWWRRRRWARLRKQIGRQRARAEGSSGRALNGPPAGPGPEAEAEGPSRAGAASEAPAGAGSGSMRFDEFGE